MKPLIVSKRKLVSGLFVFCKKCKRTIDSKKCGNTGKGLSTCKSTERHCFRAIINVPGTSGSKKKTKIFNTRDVEEAVLMQFEFEKEMKNSQYQNVNLGGSKEEVKSMYLKDCMGAYVDYLRNEGVVEHKKKERTTKHIKGVERDFKNFIRALKKNGVDYSIFKMDQINDDVVGIFHSYLLKDLKYENKTYNKIISLFRCFINWLNGDKGYTLKNAFVGVRRRYEIRDNRIITKSQFEKLLAQVVLENGIQIDKNGLRRNFYRDWMKFAFRLALETGLRREEFLSIKFSDIRVNEMGTPILIDVEDFKVNRIQDRDVNSKKYKKVPVTSGLIKLLMDLNYESNKDSDSFLIGANEKSSRETLKLVVSKAFSLFWSHTGIDEKLNLKNLRKTYLTSLAQQFGDKASIISGHSSMDVLTKHYVNSEQIIKAANSFKVF